MFKDYLLMTMILLFSMINLFCNERDFNYHPFEPTVTNARGAALGNTSVLSSSGSSFVFDNPAMLSTLKNKNLSLSSRLIFGGNKIEIEEADFDKNNSDEEDKFSSHFKINGVSCALPFEIEKMKFGFGAGFRTYYDRSYDFAHEESSDYYKSTFDRKSRLFTNMITLGTGVNFKDSFFLGLSYNFSAFNKGNIEIKNTQSYSDGTYTDKNDYDFEYSGSFYTLAGIYKLSPQLTCAVRVRTAYEHTEEYEFEMDYYKIHVLNTTEVPAEHVLALEYCNLKNLKMYIEYLSRDFNKYKGRSTWYDEEYDDIDTWLIDYWPYSKAGFSLRGGIELGTTTKFRLGSFVQSVPFYEDKLNEDPLTELGITTGVGFIFNNLLIDIYGQYSHLKYEYENSNEKDSLEEYGCNRFKLGITAGINL